MLYLNIFIYKDGEPKKISLRTLSASSTGSPVKPVTAIIQPPRNEDHSDSDEEKVVEVSHVTAPPPPPANQAAVTVVSSPSTELAILPSTTATVTPGNIANQIHNRHKRQPIPRRKERPKKIKKVNAQRPRYSSLHPHHQVATYTHTRACNKLEIRI